MSPSSASPYRSAALKTVTGVKLTILFCGGILIDTAMFAFYPERAEHSHRLQLESKV
jgi:hypothetical protein